MNEIERHKGLIERFYQCKDKGVLISVYNNASGFLWSMMMSDSGTDLGWSEYYGNCHETGTFIEYCDALEDAISLVEKCDLEEFREESKGGHWGLYAQHLNTQYRCITPSLTQKKKDKTDKRKES